MEAEMTVLQTTVFLVLLVALAFFAAMVMLDAEPFASVRSFVVCVLIALVAGVLIVGLFSSLYGPPQITKL